MGWGRKERISRQSTGLVELGKREDSLQTRKKSRYFYVIDLSEKKQVKERVTRKCSGREVEGVTGKPIACEEALVVAP